MLKLKGYRINDLLSEGRKTTVYRGINLVDNKDVIVKVLNKSAYGDDDTIRFQHEIYLTGLVHPIKDALTDEGRLCMIMEDDGSVSLSQAFKGLTLSPFQLIHTSEAIIDELSRIHDKNIIHKDLNIENVLINQANGLIRIIDFGIASELLNEHVYSEGIRGIQGTLAYIAPEQTGRMNRSVDYRSDYYALGMMLYCLMAGHRPFNYEDISELIHAHMAIVPTPPIDLIDKSYFSHEEVLAMSMISAIIMKLVSKSAEDRYQSIYGIRYDLQQCKKLLSREMNQEPTLGEKDISERFLIQEKLYGREKEVALLEAAYERICGGSRELVLIGGPSGVGKSVLVNELQKSVIRQKGYFISGKYDQFMRNIPYYAIKSAIAGLTAHIFADTEKNLQMWKNAIQEAVGVNGRIITDIFPELEDLIGIQPELPELGLDEEQQRFNETLRRFVHGLGNKNRPLVFFLDDLQWVDEPSLTMMELLLNDMEVESILLVGAYRDNEVSVDHPLFDLPKKIEHKNRAFEKAGLTEAVCRYTINHLTSLKKEDVKSLLSDALCLNDKDVSGLVNICYDKTAGNPFFIRELLEALTRESVISFNRSEGRWQWSDEIVRQYPASDNVVEFMIKQIGTLSESSQKALNCAACNGVEFSIQSLEIICGQPGSQLIEQLWQPIMLGLIRPLNDSYKFYRFEQRDTTDNNAGFSFAHDRIQQAAYELIDEDQREVHHLKIGRQLYVNSNEDMESQQVFDVVYHYNKSLGLIKETQEQLEVIHINLLAGKKALGSNAYGPAYMYLNTALSLMERYNITSQDALKLEIIKVLAQASYYIKDYGRIDGLVNEAKKLIDDPLDMIPFYLVVIRISVAERRLKEALNIGLKVLREFGIRIPSKGSVPVVLLRYYLIRRAVGKRSVEDLYKLPIMTDKRALGLSEILGSISSAAYLASPDMLPLLNFEMVRLVIAHGNYTGAQIYPIYGMITQMITGNTDEAYKYGELGYRLSQKPEFSQSRAQNVMAFYTFNHHWKRHIRESIDVFTATYRQGLNVGDTEFAAWCLHMEAVHSIYIGTELGRLAQIMDETRAKLVQMDNEMVLGVFSLMRQIICSLSGTAEDVTELDGDYFDKESSMVLFENDGDNVSAATYYVYKQILAYLYDVDFELDDNRKTLAKYKASLDGLAVLPFYGMYESLAMIRDYQRKGSKSTVKYLKTIKKNQKKMAKWAKDAPMNNLHRWHLIEGALCWEDNVKKACDHFEKALQLADESGYIWDEALVAETYGALWYEEGQKRFAAPLIRHAYALYGMWGSKSKQEQMIRRYEGLSLEHSVQEIERNHSINNTKSSTGTGTDITASEAVDMSSVLKAFQTIASEMKLDVLMNQIMNYVIENAGAQQGYLILNKKEGWVIEATGDRANEDTIKGTCLFVKDGTGVKESQQIQQRDYPLGIVRYVLRSKETVVLADVRESEYLFQDSYVSHKQPKSVIAMPLMNHNRMVGVLYLENNLMKGAFTKQHVQILKILSTQAAISIENAMLYEEMEKKVEERTADLTILNQKYEELSITDQLTKAYNRRKIDMVLEGMTKVSKGNQDLFAIILIDIDYFKSVNDELGHLKGDEVLIGLADLARRVIRKGDLFGRWGGEEFIVVCPKTDEKTALEIAERICQAVRNADFNIGRQITCSLGVSLYDQGKSMDDCLNNADKALYVAKDKGRDQVVMFGGETKE